MLPGLPPSVAVLALSVAGGCCGKTTPLWSELDPLFLRGETRTLELAELVTDDRGELELDVRFDPGAVVAEILGTTLSVTPQPGWEGSTVLQLVATDRCGNGAITGLVVDGRSDPLTDPSAACPTTITYTPPGRVPRGGRDRRHLQRLEHRGRSPRPDG